MSKQHIVHLVRPINSSTYGNLINTCTKILQQETGELRINIATMGGRRSYGFTLCNFLHTLPVPIHTHNLSTVKSMDNILFLAGERRSVSAHNKSLFRPFHWTLHGAVDHTRMAEYATNLDYDLELYARIVAKSTRDTPERLDIPSYPMAYPHILGPEDALACGLIHTADDSPIPASACQWNIHSQLPRAAQRIPASGRPWTDDRMPMPPGKAGLANDLHASDLTLEKSSASWKLGHNSMFRPGWAVE